VGFVGVQNMSLTVTLGGKGVGPLAGLAASLWSHSGSSPSALAGVAVEVLTATARVSFLTPDPVMKIPRSMNYGYSEITYFPSTISNSIPAGNQIVITQNNIQLQSIPSRILFWVGAQDSSYSINSSDCAYGITNINVSFDNRDSILSNASQEDLYQIAVKNGTNLSWRQFTRECGSYLALDFGEDIPLRATQAPGLRGSYNLRLTVTATNLAAAASIPTLNLVVVAEGVLSITDQTVIRNIGVLSSQDVLDSKAQQGVAYRATGSVYGGSFWDTLGRFAKTIGRPIIDVAKTIVPMVAPQYSGAVDVADTVGRTLGFGMPRGGKRISRKQLAALMM